MYTYTLFRLLKLVSIVTSYTYSYTQVFHVYSPKYLFYMPSYHVVFSRFDLHSRIDNSTGGKHNIEALITTLIIAIIHYVTY